MSGPITAKLDGRVFGLGVLKPKTKKPVLATVRVSNESSHFGMDRMLALEASEKLR